MQTETVNAGTYSEYLRDGRDFIDDEALRAALAAPAPAAARVREILARSLQVSEALPPEDTAALLAVTDPALLEEIYQAARDVKRKVYDNRVITFAPLYASNLCVNNCKYCGFRAGNGHAVRRKLGMAEIKAEAEALAGRIGHKRLIFVTGEHPATGAEYIAEAIRTIYSVKVPTRRGTGQIRRVNVNAAPMSVKDLKTVKAAGLGTYQVFQETYDRRLYARLHPGGTPKADYRWRLYVMHRAFEAGIDDVALGALFGLNPEWKFEVLGLVAHARELEARFGIGPHTISFPRLESADGTSLPADSLKNVSDADFKKLVAVLRLSVPYAGMIVTARERPETIREVIGPGGKVIRSIVEQTGVKIDIEDDGRVFIAAVDGEAGKRAKEIIESLVADVEVGKIYLGKVMRIMDFGAFVEVLPGKEGLVHISQLAEQRVGKVEDVVKLGDEIMVKVTKIDEQGRVNLSRKEALRAQQQPAEQK